MGVLEEEVVVVVVLVCSLRLFFWQFLTQTTVGLQELACGKQPAFALSFPDPRIKIASWEESKFASQLLSFFSPPHLSPACDKCLIHNLPGKKSSWGSGPRPQHMGPVVWQYRDLIPDNLALRPTRVA